MKRRVPKSKTKPKTAPKPTTQPTLRTPEADAFPAPRRTATKVEPKAPAKPPKQDKPAPPPPQQVPTPVTSKPTPAPGKRTAPPAKLSGSTLIDQVLVARQRVELLRGGADATVDIIEKLLDLQGEIVNIHALYSQLEDHEINAKSIVSEGKYREITKGYHALVKKLLHVWPDPDLVKS